MTNGLSVSSNKSVTVNFDSYTGNGFIKAIMLRDIVQVKLMTRLEKSKLAPGANDIIVKHAFGGNETVSRRDLINKYNRLDGKKIKLMYLKSGHWYYMSRQVNETVAVMLVNNKFKGTINGKAVKTGSYIIAKVDDAGHVLSGTASCVSSFIFRKGFSVPKQDVIDRNKGIRRKNNVKRITSDIVKPDIKHEDNKEFTVIKPNKLVGKSNVKLNPVQDSSKYKYKAVARICHIANNKDVLDGFLLENLKGVKKPVSLTDVTSLCSKSLVSNLMLVRQENGSCFLRGNGIEIKSLETMYRK